MNNEQELQLDQARFNQIPFRLESIKKLIDGKCLDYMIDFNKTEENTNQKGGSDDIRELLPKKYIDFNKAIKDLGGKLLYIKSGSTGHTFKGVYPPPNNENKPNYAVKIVAYPRKQNYGDMFNVCRPENAELIMLRLLANFVKDKQTPHLVLPITTFNTSIKPFISLPKDNIVNNKKYDAFVKRYKKGEYYENVSVLISEWANSGDLLDYIKSNYKTMKSKHWISIFFQILSALAIIQYKYPGFRHNDMKANNILVHKIETSKIHYKFKYKINDQTYIVPNIGIQIQLWDFDFACIPGIVENSKVDAEWTDKINIKATQHRYYDVHYFFNTLTKKGFFPEFWTEEEIPEKIKEFVKRVVPEKYSKEGKYVTERGRILVDDEYMTPDWILKNDPLFKVMRN
jgi:serine/threonine protein kinase